MKLIKSRRAWKLWIVKEFSHQTLRPDEPAEYPCFGYLVVADFGMEWQEPAYVYRRDLKNMLHDITAIEMQQEKAE